MQILTWNLWGLRLVDDLARLASEHDVDVFTLQEVSRHFSARSEWADVTSELATALGYACAFAPAIDLPGTERRRRLGNAIVSRLPLSNIRGWPLLSGEEWDGASWETEPRTLLECVVDGVVRVATVHLAHSPRHAASSARARQVERVAKILRLRDPRLPLVLTGDLNTPPQSPEIHKLCRLLNIADRSLAPTWPAWIEREGSLFRAKPRMKIDYVLHTPEVSCHSLRVLTDERSDHLPLLATISPWGKRQSEARAPESASTT